MIFEEKYIFLPNTWRFFIDDYVHCSKTLIIATRGLQTNVFTACFSYFRQWHVTRGGETYEYGQICCFLLGIIFNFLQPETALDKSTAGPLLKFSETTSLKQSAFIMFNIISSLREEHGKGHSNKSIPSLFYCFFSKRFQ